MRDPVLRLSRLLPVRMHSRYGVVAGDGGRDIYRATWWQWRGRVYRHRTQLA